MRKQILKLLKQKIEEASNKYRANLLGPRHVNKSFFFSLEDFDPKTTIAYNYLHGHTLHSADPAGIDKSTIKTLENAASTYIDKMEQVSLTDSSSVVNNIFDQIEQEAKLRGVDTQSIIDSPFGKKLISNMEDELIDRMNKMHSKADQIATTEIGNAQNYGIMDGIMGAAANLRIEDPVVMKLGQLSNSTCKVCLNLWHDPINPLIPRLYKLSELRGGYCDMKHPEPTVGVSHPHCVHVLSVLMPGFGFDDSGKIVYKGQGWDEYSVRSKNYK